MISRTLRLAAVETGSGIIHGPNKGMNSRRHPAEELTHFPVRNRPGAVHHDRVDFLLGRIFRDLDRVAFVIESVVAVEGSSWRRAGRTIDEGVRRGRSSH